MFKYVLDMFKTKNDSYKLKLELNIITIII